MEENNYIPEEVFLPVEDSLDLHTFHPRDIPSLLEEYIIEAIKLGYEEVRIIHGRGKGYQRAVVQTLLTENPLVLSFNDASYERGGWGATVVRLKKNV